MLSCSICGTRNADGARACTGCGAPLSPAPVSPATAAPVPHRLRIVSAGTGETRRLELIPGQYSVGRGRDCSIVIDDPYVSPLHLYLTAGATLHVQDAGSANGTFVRLRGPVQLRDGDELRLGRQRLRLEALPAPAGAVGGGRVWGSPPHGRRYRLVQLLEGGGTGEAFPLAEGDHLIGRELGTMAFPADPAVSGRHAMLAVQGDRALLRDLDSANGTFLRLTAGTDLSVGDRLLIGMQQVTYES